jgi:hypothetical protein
MDDMTGPEGIAAMAKRKPVKQTAKNGAGRKPGRDDVGRFASGGAGGPGRPAGTPNQISAQLKADILDAYEQRGGKKYLAGLADPLFVGLLGKIVPRELAADVKIQAEQPEPTIDVEIHKRICRLLDEAAAAQGVCLDSGAHMRALPPRNEDRAVIDQ